MFLTTGEVGLAGAVLTAAAGFGGAWVQSRRDDKRWMHEREREYQDRAQHNKLERDRWTREDAARWAEERRAVYESLLTSAQRWLDEVRGYGYRIDSASRPPQTNMEKWQSEVETSISKLLLIAPKPTREFALKLRTRMGLTNYYLDVGMFDISDGGWSVRDVKEHLWSDIRKAEGLLDDLILAAQLQLGTAASPSAVQEDNKTPSAQSDDTRPRITRPRSSAHDGY